MWLQPSTIHVMLGLNNPSLDGSGSNLPDTSGQSFSGQAGSASPAYHIPGSIPGVYNIHFGALSMANMGAIISSRNSSRKSVPSSGIQQPTGNVISERFASSNIAIPLCQMSHRSSHEQSVVASKGGIGIAESSGYSSNTNTVGGTIPGVLLTSTSTDNQSLLPGMGVSPVSGDAGHRIHSSMGNMAGGGNIGRSISSAGGQLSPGFDSRMNLIGSGGECLTNQAMDRLMGRVVQQDSPQVKSMFGNSYPGREQKSKGHINSLNSMGMSGDNRNESYLFGGAQTQLGSLPRHGVRPNPQQNHEFSMKNENFASLPAFKGGNTEYSNTRQKYKDMRILPPWGSLSISIGRSDGSQQHQQHAPSGRNKSLSFSQVNNSDLLHLHSSEVLPSSHSNFQSQASGRVPTIGLRSLSSSNSICGMGSYEQLSQQYQWQNQSQFRLSQMSAINSQYRDRNVNSTQLAQSTPDFFGMLGLLNVIQMSDPDLTSLAIGMDLSTLGLNLKSTENHYKTFGCPWSEGPIRGEADFSIPQCYIAEKPPTLQWSQAGGLSSFSLDSLFYDRMPKDIAQQFAASNLCKRGWFYHKEHRLWFTRVPNTEPHARTNTYERGSYLCCDPITMNTVRKDNFVVHYEMVFSNIHCIEEC